jgi:ADP-heptose:LPS heptosyltransferase
MFRAVAATALKHHLDFPTGWRRLNAKMIRKLSFRTIERRFKLWLIARLSAVMTVQPAPAPDWETRTHTILVLRYDRLGDMVLSTGIIKAIAAAQPTVRIDVLASVQNASVLEGNPYVGRIITVNRRRPLSWIRAIARVRYARYDAVVDVMVMAPSLTTMLIMWVSAARHRIGLGDRGHECVFTLPVPRLHSAVHYVDHAAALLAAFGVDPQSVMEQNAEANSSQEGHAATGRKDPGVGGWGIWRPEIFLSPAEIAQGQAQWDRAAYTGGFTDRLAVRLVINVSAGASWRYWPSACFVEALRHIRTLSPQVVCLLIGAPHDRRRMEEIGRATGITVAHTAKPRQMMAIVARSDAVFTADTAVTHIASAFRKPMLAMFARGKADLWGPYQVPGSAVARIASESLETMEVATVRAGLVEVIASAVRDARRPSSLPPDSYWARAQGDSAMARSMATKASAGTGRLCR